MQAKLWNVSNLLGVHGNLPGDIQIEQSIRFRYLRDELLEQIEGKLGIPARRTYAPLAADYIRLFNGGLHLPTPKNTNRFYSHLIDCLLVEILMLTTIQYYEGMGFSNFDIPLNFWSLITTQSLDDLRLGRISSVNYKELYARVFLEYFAYTLRAQWDKFTRLVCFAFDVNSDSDSISTVFSALEAKASNLHTDTAKFLEFYTRIGRERLAEDNWLKPFRDSIAHKTSQHSFGVFPTKNTAEKTSDFWKKALDEHDYVREAMIIGLLAMAIEGWSTV
jgi:hypothetical protein